MAFLRTSEAGDATFASTHRHELGLPRPISAGGLSSHVTDIGSENGGLSQDLIGLSSLPSSSRVSMSRRGPATARNSIAASSQVAIRPGTSASRSSKTHIPSLAAHAFFRPMSSQRLQAHRGGHPVNKESPRMEDSIDRSSQNRASMISNSTILQGSLPQINMEVPPSRGTEFTDPIIPDRATSNASPTGNTQTTVRSLGESVRLLQDRDKPHRGKSRQNSMGTNHHGSSNAKHPPSRSTLGFLSLQNRNLQPERSDNHPHGRLSFGSAGSLDVKQKQSPRHRSLGKNYEYFTGNTIFFGGGRLQNSRDKPVNIATGIFVLLPAGLFFGFSAPWLWHNISPAIPIVFAYIFYICLSSFLHASVVNPGIIPRNLHPMPPIESSDDPLAVGPPTNDWVMVRLATSDVAAMDVPVKYCKTCNIWRPPRCYHCRVCDNCVETLDHHCVWLNNCVGRRNYRYFFTFVASSTILALFLIGASLAQILVYRARESISFGAAISVWRVPFAMVIYGALAGPYPASLWVYHLFLTGRGETTREYLNSHKFVKEDRHRPFTQDNILKNWISVLVRPRPPTYLHFKQAYREGDQRLGVEKRKDRNRDLESQAGIEMQLRGSSALG